MSCLHEPERLLGRSAEESILLNSYFASLSMSKQSPAAVILIHGDSGLGKTKLAETIKPHVLGDDGCKFKVHMISCLYYYFYTLMFIMCTSYPITYIIPS